MNTNIKRWSVGSPMQAPLDGLLELIREHNIKAARVEKLVVRVSHQGADTVNNRHMPDICMQHMCAVMLLDSFVTFKSSHDFARLRDPKTARLKKRVELVGSADLASDPTDWNAHVEIRLRDGRRLEHHTPAARGGHSNPMTREEEDAKALDLLAPVLGSTRARTLIEMVWNVEALKDVRALAKLLRV